MNVTPTSGPSSRLGLKVFVLVLAWVVVAGLSWAELIGLQAESGGVVPADSQWATEPDLDEVRDEATTKALTEASRPASLAIHASASKSSVPFSPGDTPLPTGDLLSTLSVYRL